MSLTHIDREELHARIEELQSCAAELEALLLLRDMLYCVDEGIVTLDAAGGCYPSGDPS